MMRGELKDCYAITESGPGSDIAGLEATATSGLVTTYILKRR